MESGLKPRVTVILKALDNVTGLWKDAAEQLTLWIELPLLYSRKEGRDD